MSYEKPQTTKQQLLAQLAEVNYQMQLETNSLTKLALASRQRLLKRQLNDFKPAKPNIQ